MIIKYIFHLSCRKVPIIENYISLIPEMLTKKIQAVIRDFGSIVRVPLPLINYRRVFRDERITPYYRAFKPNSIVDFKDL